MSRTQQPSGSTTPVTEGYPSWLPRRPAGPAPQSTVHSATQPQPTTPIAGPSTPQRAHTTMDAPPMIEDDENLPRESSSSGGPPPFVGGRKPTPRSMRVVRVEPGASLDADTLGRRIPTDATRVPGMSNHPRAYSRTGTPATLNGHALDRQRRPRFRARGFRPVLLRDPSIWARLRFYTLWITVFYHVPLQSFLDFNAVYILLQLAQRPNIGSSGRSWTLGAVAYIACWAFWIFAVVLIYELVYSFARRWRVKRPLMMPIYLSAPGSDLARMTSFTHFSFIEHVRRSAWSPESNGGLRDGFAELCWRYGQNLPTMSTLMPRACLALAVLLNFWTAPTLVSASAGMRDGTFFNRNGALTAYARVVLAANVAWTMWRAVVLLSAWIGLWITSGQIGAGLFGPRYRWEEMEAEKRASIYSSTDLSLSGAGGDEPDALPWAWRERTALRVQEAFVFCSEDLRDLRASYYEKGPGAGLGLGLGLGAGLGAGSGAGTGPRMMMQRTVDSDSIGVQRVLAAIGMPGSPQAARRPVLSNELFRTPGQELDDPMAVQEVMREKRTTPTGSLHPTFPEPYPFKGMGSQDRVPFPPSPVPDEEGTSEEEEEDVAEEEEEDDVEGEEQDDVEIASEHPSSQVQPRSSGSMSSLGRPMASRYPFQFRRPAQRNSVSSTRSPKSPTSPHSHLTPNTRSGYTTSSGARSGFSASTGNEESPESVLSHAVQSSASGHVHRASDTHIVIPAPPAGPNRNRRRRAGTVPHSPSPTTGEPILGRPMVRMRTDTDTSAESGISGLSGSGESGLSGVSHTFGPIPLELDERSDAGSHESASHRSVSTSALEHGEAADAVGLLSMSAQPSPRGSLANMRAKANSLVSGGASARSRAQSLIASIGAASRSSVDVVAGAIAAARARTDSMARLSDAPDYLPSRSGSRSASHSASTSTSDAGGLSPTENHTFGMPLRVGGLGGMRNSGVRLAPSVEDVRREAQEDNEDVGQLATLPPTPRRVRGTRSALSVLAPSERLSTRTVTRPGSGPHRGSGEQGDGMDGSDNSDDDFGVERDMEDTQAYSTIRGPAFTGSAPIAIPSPTSPFSTTSQWQRPPLARHSTTDLTVSTARQSFVTAPTTPAAESTLGGWTPSTTHTGAAGAGRGMYAPYGYNAQGPA